MEDNTTKASPTKGGSAPVTTPKAATVEDEPPSSPPNRTTTSSEEAPPPKPPRPTTEQQKNEAILKEAFPGIEASVIKAVLIASGGRIDPAFNALLAMSDPDAVHPDAEIDVPPPQPPRPQNAQSQLEADEAYARRLAEHYESAAYEARTSNRRDLPGSRPGRPGGRGGQTGLKPNELYDDREHSFIDDDLPVIQEQLKKGFQETQVKVNSWFKDLKKKFDEQFDEGGSSSQQGGQRFGGNGSGESARRSRDYERYDADPEMLSDDFAGMKFHGDGSKCFFPPLHGHALEQRANRATQPPLVLVSQTLTFSGLHHPLHLPSPVTGARLPSRMAPTRSITFTTPLQRVVPRTPQARPARQASGSPCQLSSLAPLQRTTHSASATAMTIRTPKTSRTRVAARWMMTRRDCERLRRRPCRIVWWTLSLTKLRLRSEVLSGYRSCVEMLMIPGRFPWTRVSRSCAEYAPPSTQITHEFL